MSGAKFHALWSVVFLLVSEPLFAQNQAAQAPNSANSTPPPVQDRRAQILQWDYPRDVLYGNTDSATKVAYAETIYHFSSAGGATKRPTPDEVTSYFNDRKQAF